MADNHNPINFKKLPGSKWTATKPMAKEKHFIVLGWQLDENGEPTDQVEIEAVYTKRVRLLHWRELSNKEAWRIGWQ